MDVKKIGIVGLGLIGGSLAKAFKQYTDCIVEGYDCEPEIITRAIKDGVIDGELILEECEFLICALYPDATVEFLKSNADRIKKGAFVCDCGGTKSLVCDRCEQLAKDNDFVFVGMHPMAGTEHSGYSFASADLFVEASIVICSENKIPFVEELYSKIGFKTFRYTTKENHDKMIAFTSQLAHVVSNAFVKSPQYAIHGGYSAGSLKDLTRVAWLNETMWTELFLQNRDFLAGEIDFLISNLTKYSDAIKQGDSKKLKVLLQEGRKIKEKVDGRE